MCVILYIIIHDIRNKTRRKLSRRNYQGEFIKEKLSRRNYQGETTKDNMSITYEQVVNAGHVSPVHTYNGVCYLTRSASVDKKHVAFLASDHFGCRECTRRARSMADLHGPDGPIFLSDPDWMRISPSSHGEMVSSVHKLREYVTGVVTNIDPEDIVIVSTSTFPVLRAGGHDHWTITPSAVTPDTLARQILKMKSNYPVHMITGRLLKFMSFRSTITSPRGDPPIFFFKFTTQSVPLSCFFCSFLLFDSLQRAY